MVRLSASPDFSADCWSAALRYSIFSVCVKIFRSSTSFFAPSASTLSAFCAYAEVTFRISESSTFMPLPISEMACLYSFSPESVNFVLMFGMLGASVQIGRQALRLFLLLRLLLRRKRVKQERYAARGHGFPEIPLRQMQPEEPDCEEAGEIKAQLLRFPRRCQFFSSSDVFSPSSSSGGVTAAWISG